MQWCANTAVKGLGVSLAGAMLVGVMSSAALADANKDAAGVSANSVLGKYGTKQGFKQNLAAPMTSSGSQLSTMDGSKGFSVTQSTPSSNSFLQVMIQPSGTGDLSTVYVAQDLDTNGSFDYTFTLGTPVSGVCANGFISCSPGTWNNCKAYKWISDDTGKLSVAATGITSLGGCYCINSSCGSNLVWSNSPIVLKDLGGGAVGAIHAKDSSVMISNVSTDVTTITYYGQIIKQGAAQGGTPASVQQQSYYGNSMSLDSDVQQTRLAGVSDPDSMYYKMLNSSAAQGGASSQTCKIERTGALLSEPVASFYENGTSGICVDHFLYMMIRPTSLTSYQLMLAGTGPGGLGQIGHNCGGAGWQVQHTINLPPETKDYQVKLTKALYSISNISGGGCISGGSASIDGITSGFNNAIMATAPCPAGGAQSPSFTWSYLFEFSTDRYQEHVTNTCGAFEADSTCRLQTEQIDGVTTVNNYVKTGLTPLPNCQTFDGVVRPMEICRDWWKKTRRYTCQAQPTDLSAAVNRFSGVVTSTSDGVTTLTYNDTRLNKSGEWVAENGNIALPERDSYDDCEAACKVRKVVTDTQVGVTGVMSENRANSSTNLEYYRVCTDNGATCPVEAGETVLEACACTNQFGQSASIMQTLRLAGQDNVCSSGTPVQ